MSELLSPNTNIDSDLKAKFSRLELSADIACVCSKRFMNKNMKIIRHNISELENEMKKHLTYFKKWCKYSISLKKTKMIKSRINICVTRNLQ